MPDLTDEQLDQLIVDIGLNRPRGGSKYKPIAHGTLAGAKQHRYRKEPVCEPCRGAERDYQRERYGVRRASEVPDGQPSPLFLTEEQWQERVAARKAGGGRG